MAVEVDAIPLDVVVGVDVTPPSDTLLQQSRSAIDALDHLLRDAGRASGHEPASSTDGQGPVVELVAQLIRHAFLSRASDLHLEPQVEAVRVRCRIDGTMIELIQLPMGIHGAVVNRVKVMAGLDIVEHRRPQDGHATVVVDDVTLDVRVATLPTVFGEKVVLRLLDRRQSVRSLEELGMSATDAAACRRLMRSTFGLVLCAGPTGAGKTTTLYASLLDVDTTGRNVTTIEDPVEYVVSGITQVSTNTGAGITFATGLRALLRQDPDVILVGEIRDVETAAISVQSALTGHLVLSSIHSTDAIGALHRLIDMGLESFLVASAVTGVIAQRLIRRTCSDCACPATPPGHERLFFRRYGGDVSGAAFAVGKGCASCAGTGYRGRIGVYELLIVSAALRESLVARRSIDHARRQAVDDGMQSMMTAGVRLVEQGVTTIPEVARLLHSV